MYPLKKKYRNNNNNNKTGEAGTKYDMYRLLLSVTSHVCTLHTQTQLGDPHFFGWFLRELLKLGLFDFLFFLLFIRSNR